MTEMATVASALYLILGLAAFAFIWLRGRTLLMFFQQEEYDGRRFLRWLIARRAVDLTASAFALAALVVPPFLLEYVVTLAGVGAPHLALALLIVGTLSGAWRSRRLVATSKKPLVMTARARRILSVYMAIAIAGTTALIVLLRQWAAGGMAIAVILVAQGLPLMLVLANALLGPAEARVKARYRAEAAEKRARLNPVIIAITGSYGKTSAKHILAHILSTAAPTLATPGSVNTEMGITRIIRQQLKAHHRYFIVEMGAYGRGSITRLCALTPPQHGLITAVGQAHLERFGDTETVFAAKFELADAVANAGGRTVVNADQIPHRLLAHRLGDAGEAFTVVGRDDDLALDYRLDRMAQTGDGLTIDVTDPNGEAIRLEAPLFGTHQGLNILAAAALARNLGLPWDVIRAALKTVPQIAHRLEVYEQSAGGPLIIDDAYNANPTGFSAALELLDILKRDDGRRIVITPGMVELGPDHDTEHRRLGRLAAAHCDIALVVTPQRIPSFVDGFQSAASKNQNLIPFTRQADAEAWLAANSGPEDVILYENNLPDLYESAVRL